MSIDPFAPDTLGLRAQMTIAAAGLRFSAVGYLRDLGASPRWLAQACAEGALGRARVSYSRDGDLFDFAQGDGETAIILPVTEDGLVTDLVAFDPRTPDAWALRGGDGLMLGWDVWHANAHAPDTGGGWREDPAVRLFANPLQWIRGGGEGLCLLAWNVTTMGMLRALGPERTIVCEGDHFATVVAERMAERCGLPAVSVAPVEMVLPASMAANMQLEAAE
ncbi:MAG: hypothetical protein ACK4ZW_05835 [Blastomonas sp.]